VSKQYRRYGIGNWYKDQLVQYDGQENQYTDLVINNPRVRTCMYVEEFVQYTNNLEEAVRLHLMDLDELGVEMVTMDKLISILNDTNGGA
jgi:hypothetical protein